MAEVTVDVDRDAELTVIKVVGELNSGELKQVMLDYYAGGPTRLILMDFSEGHWPKISMDGYIRESQNSEQYSRPGGRTALLFSNQSDFGIGRLLETYFGLTATMTELNCFMAEDDARKWLYREE
ncbi:MAG: hypothetical protein RL120_12210 [Gammaproteobacteria bacterium]